MTTDPLATGTARFNALVAEVSDDAHHDPETVTDRVLFDVWTSAKALQRQHPEFEAAFHALANHYGYL